MLHLLARIILGLIVLTGSFLAQTGNEPIKPQVKISNLVISEVRADDTSKEISRLVELLKRERAKGPSKLVVRVEGIEIDVAPEPKVPNELSVYPNPLLLILTADANGNLDLNSEKHGSLKDLSPIAKRLLEIFKAREVNGVFRDGTNDIEKTVSLRVHPTLKVGDLGTIVSTVDASGSDQIMLLIDPREEIEEITLPQVHSKPKKSKKP